MADMTCTKQHPHVPPISGYHHDHDHDGLCRYTSQKNSGAHTLTQGKSCQYLTYMWRHTALCPRQVQDNNACAHDAKYSKLDMKHTTQIADFGFSQKKKVIRMCGTPAFLAPEVPSQQNMPCIRIWQACTVCCKTAHESLRFQFDLLTLSWLACDGWHMATSH